MQNGAVCSIISVPPVRKQKFLCKWQINTPAGTVCSGSIPECYTVLIIDETSRILGIDHLSSVFHSTG